MHFLGDITKGKCEDEHTKKTTTENKRERKRRDEMNWERKEREGKARERERKGGRDQAILKHLSNLSRTCGGC